MFRIRCLSFPFGWSCGSSIEVSIHIRTSKNNTIPFDTTRARTIKITKNKRVNYEISSVWVHLSVNMYCTSPVPWRTSSDSGVSLSIFLFYQIFFLLLLLFSLLYITYAQKSRTLTISVYFKWPGAEWFLFLSVSIYLYFGFLRQAHTLCVNSVYK